MVDQAGFEGWKQGFLARHSGERRAAYERELAGLEPDADHRLALDDEQRQPPVLPGIHDPLGVANRAVRPRVELPWQVFERDVAGPLVLAVAAAHRFGGVALGRHF